MMKQFPRQIKYIVGNEAAERYSYYGMRSILVIFMVQYLMMDGSHATSVYHLFAGACYLLPILGAYISDRYLGKYKTIMYLSVVYCLGHLVLALWENKLGLYWGLGLIALGSGGIKPCVSAHVGDQFDVSEEHLLRKVFNLFYWMINFGSFFASIITPWTLPKFGPGIAFGVPGILMAIATYVFWLGRHYYVHVPPTGKNPDGLIPVILSAIKSRKKGRGFFEGALDHHEGHHVEAVKSVWGVGKIFFAVSVFWALFDQHGSTWVLQAKEMELHFMGMDLLPSQIPALNPIMVMALIPFNARFLFPLIEKMGIEVTPLRKMSAGMIIAAFSFVMVAVIQFLLDSGVRVNVAWQFFPFLTITLAEVLVSITGLEFAYTQSPRSMKSSIMSLWLLTVFFGNMITAYIAQVNKFEGGNFFMFFATLMFLVGLFFVWMAKNYKMQNYMESKT